MSHLESLHYKLFLHGEMPGGEPATENNSACERCTEQLHNTSQYRAQRQRARYHLEPHTPQVHPSDLLLSGMQQPQDMTTPVNDLQHHDQELPQRGAPDVHEQHCRPLLLQLSSSTNHDEHILRTALHSPGLEHLLQGANHQLGPTAVRKDVQVSRLQKGDGHLEDPQGELLNKLHGLNLGEQGVQVYSANEEQQLHPPLHTLGNVKLFSTDIKYPETLSTEESPRRRARSLPWNAIPEADVEEEEDSLMCCCKLKKKVKFADSFGLTLASVKHFLPSDEPLVPRAVLARLQSYPPTVCAQRAELNLEEDMFRAEWVPPSIIPAELLTRLDEQGVCLEQVSSSSWGVRGSVLVKAPEEKAQVKIRYTFNEWLSFLDCLAFAAEEGAPFHVPGTRRFYFNLNYPPSTSCLHFAICLNTGDGQELWDNNKGVNYTVSFQQDQLPEVQSSSPEQEEWGGSRLW
ncbi:protein phosphatase 1 regulatory subunit 3G [Pseudophryne corroboree]|uniref:protein phosphatase 1 regulatory subunit 3G n=1 Tax=Pseudophryne corroboree TaxID=495146 RepID=UPI0030815C04